jgi:hypothetical protein
MNKHTLQAWLLLTTLLAASLAQAAGLVQLPRTGQTTCWSDAGVVIDCAGTGQDGETRMGASFPALRFVDNGDGTISDTMTGLVWLKNAHCADTVGGVAVTYTGYPVNPDKFGFSWQNALNWSNALASGNCGLSDGSHAGDWRLPNEREMSSLINREGAPGTWLTSKGFLNVYQGSAYWSSSTFIYGPGGALQVSMVLGNSFNAGKAVINAAWPVRDPR